MRPAPAQPACRPRPPAPLAPVAVGVVLGIGLGACGGGRAWLFAMLLVAIGLVMWLGLRRGGTLNLLAAAGLLFAVLGLLRYQQVTRLPPDHVARQAAAAPLLTEVTGVIATTPEERVAARRNPFRSQRRTRRTLFELDGVHWTAGEQPVPARGRLLVVIDGGVGLRLGQRVRLAGFLEQPTPQQNPGGFDWRSVLALRGVHAVLRVPAVAHVQRLPAKPPTWATRLAHVRSTVRKSLRPPDVTTASAVERLVAVLVLGQRSLANDELEEAFRRTGTAHFLAVSGFHVGVLAGAFWWLGRRCRLSRRWNAALVAIVVLLYWLIAEPAVPITRAAILTWILCLAVMLRRGIAPLNWLALAVIVLLLVEPRNLFAPSFQLSVTVVFALVLVMPRLPLGGSFRTRLEETPAVALSRWVAVSGGRLLAQLTAVSVIAWLVTQPILAHHFSQVTPLGPLFTLLTLPLVVILVPLGFASVILEAGLNAAGWTLPPISSWVAAGLLVWVDWLASWPGSAVPVTSPPAWLVVVTLALVLGPLLLDDSAALNPDRPPPAPWPTRRTVATLALAGALWVGWLVVPRPRSADVVLHTLSLGRGAATIVRTPQADILLDCGTLQNRDAGGIASQALRRLGAGRLDTVVIAHANVTRYSGVPGVLEQFAPRRLHVSTHFHAAADARPVWRKLERLAGPLPAIETLAGGDTLHWGPAQATVLWPPAELDAPEWLPRDRGLVLRMTVGTQRLLLLGDLGARGVRGLLERFADQPDALRADVLYAPNHGAFDEKLTPRLLAAVTPRVIVISSDRPRPRWRALAASQPRPLLVLNTAVDGAVTVRLQPGGGLVVVTPYADGGRRGVRLFDSR